MCNVFDEFAKTACSFGIFRGTRINSLGCGTQAVLFGKIMKAKLWKYRSILDIVLIAICDVIFLKILVALELRENWE